MKFLIIIRYMYISIFSTLINVFRNLFYKFHESVRFRVNLSSFIYLHPVNGLKKNRTGECAYFAIIIKLWPNHSREEWDIRAGARPLTGRRINKSQLRELMRRVILSPVALGIRRIRGWRHFYRVLLLLVQWRWRFCPLVNPIIVFLKTCIVVYLLYSLDSLLFVLSKIDSSLKI